MRKLLFVLLFSTAALALDRPKTIHWVSVSNHAVLQRDRPIPVWGKGGATNITVNFAGTTTRAKADATGAWRVDLPQQKAGGPYEMNITCDDVNVAVTDLLVGDVWLCSGQSNMEWALYKVIDADKHVAAANHPQIRLCQVPLQATGEPEANVKRDWNACTPQTAHSFSAVGYFFGRDLNKHLGVPIGLIQSTWGGTPAQAWTSREALDVEPSLKYYLDNLQKAVEAYDPAQAKEALERAKTNYSEVVAKAQADGKPIPPEPRLRPDPRTVPNPTTLYNAMIAPLIPTGLRGVIWYQGESNGSKGFEYRTLFPTMIKDWRQRWHQDDLPFLCVQLAPFSSGNPDGPQWAELREAQLLATKKLQAVGMAVITDLGEKDDVHPRNKEPVGSRLALLARSIAYGETIVANGPQFRSMDVNGNKVVLHFESVGGGLEARGGALKGFEICGQNGEFRPANAEIQGDTVIVGNDSTDQPVAVRYGWKNYPEVNLFNRDGLPASPFRTDDFPLTSDPSVKKAK